ncbi:MAG: hypothetical protein GHCLOJNM_01759 [bacterium]|nr:hypothetical protein [bacterium]
MAEGKSITQRKTFLQAAVFAFGALFLWWLLAWPSGPRYRITDLGVLSKHAQVRAVAINDRGEVVGSAAVPRPKDSSPGNMQQFVPPFVTHPFLWTRESGMKDLGLSQGTTGTAVEIDPLGRILVVETVEEFTPGGPSVYGGAFGVYGAGAPLRQPKRIHLIRSASAEEVVLSITGFTSIEDVLFGSGGAFVVAAQDMEGPKRAPPRPYRRLFRWTSECGFEDLGDLGGPVVHPAAVNSSGWIAGYGSTASGEQHAFVWTPDKGMRDIHLSGMKGSSAAALNQRGQVAGAFPTGGDFDEYEPFLWDNGTHAFLAMKSFESCRPLALNDRGEIVGDGIDIPLAQKFYNRFKQFRWVRQLWNQISDRIGAKSSAVLWKDGALYDLTNQLVDGKGWVLLIAKDINNKGQIVGEGTINGKYRAFLLDPVGN